MLFDPSLLSYLKQIISIEEEEITNDRIASAKKALEEKDVDYEFKCNVKLVNLVDPREEEFTKSSFVELSIILILIQIIFLY